MGHTAKSDKKLAVGGALWTVGGYGTAQVLRLVSNLVLAKLLAPDAFGMMALVAVVMQGVQMTTDVGLTSNIIQSKRGEDDDFLRTAWTMQVLRGFCLCLVICLLARPMAAFYTSSEADSSLLARILWVISLTPILTGFSSTSVAILRRRMIVSSTVVLELVPQVISVAAMVVAACAGASVWALVLGWLVHSGSQSIISHLLLRERRDRLGWDRDCARELFGFGRWVFASTALSFLAMNLDKLLLGKLLTLTDLGLYSIALTFAKVAIDLATRLSGTVIFPLLARHREDSERMMQVCLRGRRTVLTASGALGTAFLIGAPLFFELLYDEAYHGAGQVAQYLCLYVWAWALVATVDRVPLALGRPKVLFVTNILTMLGMGVAVAGYQFQGLAGFICGMALAQVLGLVYVVWTLPHGRRACWLQTAGFSLGYGAYGAVSLIVLEMVDDVALGGRLLLVGALLLPLATVVLRMLGRELKMSPMDVVKRAREIHARRSKRYS